MPCFKSSESRQYCARRNKEWNECVGMATLDERCTVCQTGRKLPQPGNLLWCLLAHALGIIRSASSAKPSSVATYPFVPTPSSASAERSSATYRGRWFSGSYSLHASREEAYSLQTPWSSNSNTMLSFWSRSNYLIRDAFFHAVGGRSSNNRLISL